MGALIAHDVSIESFLDETLPLVNADKTQIQQVALNLLTNAMDAMAQNPPDKRKVTLKTELIEGFVRVAVHDYGPGISTEQADKIFDPFYTTKSNGLGMGLAVCKSIITDHEGHIWAEKDPEGGETFFFSLKAEEHA
jgi:two-component system, LuxR family, sensor kinase FixL